MRDDVSVKYDLHVFLGIWQRIFAGSEEIQDRVYEYQGRSHEYKSDDYVEADHVAEHLVCGLVVLLSKQDREHHRGTGSHESAECGRKVHQRKGDRQSRYGEWTYTLPDEDAVHQIVEGCRSLCDNGRKGILLEQSAYLFSAEFCGD